MQSIRQPKWRDLAILLVGYVALDWASFFHSLHALNITPWNPAPALGLIYLLRFGRAAVLPLALAIFLADASVRHLPVSLLVSIGLSLLLAAGYWLIAAILRLRLASGAIFSDQRGLLEWAVIVVLGTLFNSALYVATLRFGNLIPGSSVADAFVRYWVGDFVGVLVTMPLLWFLLDGRGAVRVAAIARSWESLGYLAASVLALWISFGVDVAAEFKYFYLLFPPVMWAASRRGLAGAVFSVAIIQVGIIAAVQVLGYPAVNVLEIQILAAALALFGFFSGVVVDEKQRVSAELRQTLRLAAAGEMAGALAHELNQPLTALSAYGSACKTLVELGQTGAQLSEVIDRLVAETFRAGDVLRRLRDFFRTGATRLEHVRIAELIASVAGSMGDRATQRGVELTLGDVPDYTLLADRMQIEVVLRNLLSNAFDALAEQAAGKRRIWLTVRQEGAGRLGVCIENSGPGISSANAERLFEAFHTSKESGLGLGLVISRAIVEAHGGHLWAEAADHGFFRLILPMEGKLEHANQGIHGLHR